MANTQTREPALIVAGDTITWQSSLSEFPASDGWVLHYRLINSTHKYDIDCSAAGDNHLASVAAAVSATWAAGYYSWTAYVTKADARYTIGNGTLMIKADLAAAAAGVDTRSHAVRTLEAIEAVIEGRATQAHQEYAILGRQMKFIPIAELLVLRDRYRSEVASEQAAERAAAGLPSQRNVRVRL